MLRLYIWLAAPSICCAVSWSCCLVCDKNVFSLYIVQNITLNGTLVLFILLCRCYLSPSDIMRNQPHLLVIGTGSAFGYLVVSCILFLGSLNLNC
jgi:hypothetical protein